MNEAPERPSGSTQDMTPEPRRVATQDLPRVNGGGRKEIRLSISVVIGFIMMLVGVATFASNFIFATKSEVLKEQVDRLESEKSVQANISGVKSDVANLQTEVQNVKEDVKEVSNKLEDFSEDVTKRQDVLDQNLRKLLIQEGLRPVPKPKREGGSK